MKRLSNVLAWGAVALAGALIVLNWSVLMAPADLNLVVMQVQAPLGIVLLSMAGVLLALFLVAYMQNQIGSLLETRKLLKEIQRVQELADKAEASRLENLHQLISTEFRRLNERVDAAVTATTAVKEPPPRATRDDEPPFAKILPPPM